MVLLYILVNTQVDFVSFPKIVPEMKKFLDTILSYNI